MENIQEEMLEKQEMNEEEETPARKSKTFKELGLNEAILKTIQEHGFETPSEIQEKSIPLVLQGKDVIAGASTGSGKTLAFGSAILDKCKKDFGIQALVLTPTRELAEQIAKALGKFGKHSNLNIVPVYGGVSINPQIEDLESAEVVIATPGRILDHLERQTIDLSHIKILVLDEADRMLDMGFKEDVENIISQCQKHRQTLLYSATISPEISLLAKKFMNNPVEVAAESYVDPSKLTQVFYDVDDKLKYSLLVHLLKNENAKLVMVFCNTRRNVDFVANNLKANGIDSLPIHGGFTQDKRNRIMEQFHSNKITVLICTDVAARGLDIKGVSHVYNYDMPADSKEYIHRIGRTARAGKEGKVINILSSRDYDNFRSILRNDEIKIKQEKTPYLERVNIRWIPERRGERNSRGRGNRDSRGNNNFRPRSNSNFRPRSNNREDNRRSDRREGSSGRYGNKSRDNRSSSFGKSRYSSSRNRDSSHSRSHSNSRRPRY